MQKLREESRCPLNRRSIWEACGRRKVLAALLLAGWVITNSTTSVGSPHNASQSGSEDALRSASTEPPHSVFNQYQRTQAQQFQAGASAIQGEISDQSAIPAEAEASDGLKCLALNIYWEARNQSVAGQLAVAQVTLNRVRDQRYGNSICDVVYQHKQFSWYWDGKSDVPMENRAWERAFLIASAALNGSGHVQLQGVTHYHAVYSKPFWKDYMVKVTKIDDHIFYIE